MYQSCGQKLLLQDSFQQLPFRGAQHRQLTFRRMRQAKSHCQPLKFDRRLDRISREPTVLQVRSSDAQGAPGCLARASCNASLKRSIAILSKQCSHIIVHAILHGRSGGLAGPRSALAASSSFAMMALQELLKSLERASDSQQPASHDQAFCRFADHKKPVAPITYSLGA